MSNTQENNRGMTRRESLVAMFGLPPILRKVILNTQLTSTEIGVSQEKEPTELTWEDLPEEIQDFLLQADDSADKGFLKVMEAVLNSLQKGETVEMRAGLVVETDRGILESQKFIPNEYLIHGNEVAFRHQYISDLQKFIKDVASEGEIDLKATMREDSLAAFGTFDRGVIVKYFDQNKDTHQVIKYLYEEDLGNFSPTVIIQMYNNGSVSEVHRLKLSSNSEDEVEPAILDQVKLISVQPRN